MASRGEVLRALQDDHRHLESLAARQNATEAALAHVDADSGKVWLCMGDSFIRLPSERAADVLRQDQARTTKIREGVESDIRDRSAHLASTSDVTGTPAVPSMVQFNAPPHAGGTSGASTTISSAPFARPRVTGSASSPSSRPARDTARVKRSEDRVDPSDSTPRQKDPGLQSAAATSSLSLQRDFDFEDGDDEATDEAAAARSEFVDFVHQWQAKTA